MDEEYQQELLNHINEKPHLLSALWDLGLMPEQIERDSDQWWFIMGIAFRDKEAERITNMKHHI